MDVGGKKREESIGVQICVIYCSLLIEHHTQGGLSTSKNNPALIHHKCWWEKEHELMDRQPLLQEHATSLFCSFMWKSATWVSFLKIELFDEQNSCDLNICIVLSGHTQPHAKEVVGCFTSSRCQGLSGARMPLHAQPLCSARGAKHVKQGERRNL